MECTKLNCPMQVETVTENCGDSCPWRTTVKLDDLISRAALGIGKCDPKIFNDLAYGDGWNACVEIIEAAPAVDAAPVVHGRWIASDKYKGYLVCSNCADAYVAPAWLDEGKWRYCPACGARMDGEADG